MSMRGSIQTMRDSFGEQFEPVGEASYLYRHNQKGEPIPVSAEERERFIRQYVRRAWIILAAMTAALLIFIGLVVWRAVETRDFPEIQLYAGTIAIAIAFIGVMYWVRSAPARELVGRSSVGRERSREEMRAIFFKKISYGQLATAAVGGAILPFMLRSQPDVMHGWGRLWLLFGGSIVLLAAIQAFRKWRFESDNRNDGTY